jgi:DNA (cytosine-5)-methyltransferase 1
MKPDWWDKIKKPPYAVPSMAAIAEVPKNGYRAASTFSGCGGSSLGYKMAGFTVLWANEFIPAAQETYRANHPTTTLDMRDIRQIHPEEVLAQMGLAAGELDLFDGSPPCASFSTAGKRSAGWGEVKKYSDSAQRTDDLFFEYTRLLRGIKPKVFIAENVSGLVRGVAKGYFLNILAELKDCGYHVEARLLDAQWLGVPQSRQRLIFMGIRKDFNIVPQFPSPLRYRYTVSEAIPWLADLRFMPHGPNSFTVPEDPMDRPVPAVLAQAESGTWARHESAIQVIHDTGGIFSKGNVIDQLSPCIMANLVDLYVLMPNPGRAIEDTGGAWGVGDITDRPAPTIRASGVGHLVIEAESDISRYAIGKEWDKLNPGEQSDKYFQLVKQDPNMPCQMIPAAGGNSSIAGITHPYVRRKFSIAELKRICAFPDDFILTGTYTQQWERLGRAVPPIMMFHVAKAVQGVLDAIHGVQR